MLKEQLKHPPASSASVACQRYASVYMRVYKSFICSGVAPMYHFTPMMKCTAVAFGLPHACSRRPLVCAAGVRTYAPQTLLHVDDQACRPQCCE